MYKVGFSSCPEDGKHICDPSENILLGGFAHPTRHFTSCPLVIGYVRKICSQKTGEIEKQERKEGRWSGARNREERRVKKRKG
jgi:hypothetical protein